MAGETTETALLAAIISQLKSALTLNDNRCYPVSEPNTQKPDLPGSGPYVLQVSLGEPESLGEEQDSEQCLQRIPVEVTIYTTVKLDRADRDDKMLDATDRGMLPLRRLVRKALVGLQVTGGMSLISFGHSSRPRLDKEQGVSWQTIVFNADIDLDLQT